MKEMSAHQAKRVSTKPSAPKIVTVYTIDGVKMTFAELYRHVLKRNPDVGESKVHSRLSRGHRTIAALSADTLPPRKTKFYSR